MHESFESMIRNQKETLATVNGEVEHDSLKHLKEDKRLKNRLRKTSLHNILMWFDAIESTSVNGREKIRWRTEETKRDKLFLEKLGVKPRG